MTPCQQIYANKRHTAYKNNIRDQPKWQSRKTLNSPLLRSTRKSQLFAEHPSMKKTRTDQKIPSTTTDIKKEPK